MPALATNEIKKFNLNHRNDANNALIHPPITFSNHKKNFKIICRQIG